MLGKHARFTDRGADFYEALRVETDRMRRCLPSPDPALYEAIAVDYERPSQRTHVDLDDKEHAIALAAAGTGWDRETAGLRCWAELVERFVACAPQVVSGVVQERQTCHGDYLPWWAFTSYDAALVDRLDRAAPDEHDFVCVARGWHSNQ